MYGPKQDENRILPQIIKGCLANKTFPVSKGNQIRDFCYIDDTVSAILLILREKKAVGQAFNVATGIPVKIKAVINLITKIVGKGKPEFNKRDLREGENEILYADIKKALALMSLHTGSVQASHWQSGEIERYCLRLRAKHLGQIDQAFLGAQAILDPKLPNKILYKCQGFQ